MVAMSSLGSLILRILRGIERLTLVPWQPHPFKSGALAAHLSVCAQTNGSVYNDRLAYIAS